MKPYVITLDGRHKGSHCWKYFVDCPTGLVIRQRFFEWRNWCNSTWGDSKELDEILDDRRHDLFVHSMIGNTPQITKYDPISHNKHWCWNTVSKYRLYLKSDEELSYFLLRWSD